MIQSETQPSNTEKVNKREKRDKVADRQAVLEALEAVKTEKITQKEAYERAGLPMNIFYDHKREILAERKGTTKKSGKKGKPRKNIHVVGQEGNKGKVLSLPSASDGLVSQEHPEDKLRETVLRKLIEQYKDELRNEAMEMAKSELLEELSK